MFFIDEKISLAGLFSEKFHQKALRSFWKRSNKKLQNVLKKFYGRIETDNFAVDG